MKNCTEQEYDVAQSLLMDAIDYGAEDAVESNVHEKARTALSTAKDILNLQNPLPRP